MVKVVVCGGSIGGLSAALNLHKAGCEVLVYERASAIQPAGAGLGLDPDTVETMGELGLQEAFNLISRPIPFEEYRWLDSQAEQPGRAGVPIIINRQHNHVSLHWSDLHRMLYDALPTGIVKQAHSITAFQQHTNRVRVTVEQRADSSLPATFEVEADLLVAADGANSTVRKLLRPDDRRRYSGMIAWRGVVDGSSHPELLQALIEDYEHLDRGIIFDISSDCCMNLIYLLPGNRINWLWYRDAPEPKLSSHSVTVSATADDIRQLLSDADATWTPAFARLIKATERPFINAIFDKDPLSSWTYGRVVLVGEAAHPTTPHGSRSTNMSLQDSFALGRCIAASLDDIPQALQAFEKLRVQQTSQEVLFSRYVGEIRQGRWIDPRSFDWLSKPASTRTMLLNASRSIPDFHTVALGEFQSAGITVAGV
ncbi:hypothetical protein WJX84_003540 [Apatococcus fuscideae]|uniref:FAD-binding domain-containing protein n=1 Tax=Apatococcus fuscideae TaxID=2026836 RepID=A0AAW1T3G5_9CHLO